MLALADSIHAWAGNAVTIVLVLPHMPASLGHRVLAYACYGLAILSVCLTACSPDAAASGPPAHPGARQHGGKGDGTGEHKAEARLYAAASLTDVLATLAKEFEPIRDSRVVASYGASNTLAQQLHEGAAPGVFISASVEWVDKLAGWDLVESGTRVDLLGNSLVVIVPKDSKTRPSKLEDLTDPRFARIALADYTAVPAGKYARAALEKAAVFEKIRGNVVQAQDVRAALSYVERGEAQAGIVYATDAAGSAKVDVAVRIPQDLHPKIVYPMVLVKGANRRAHELHEFLRSEKAWPVFERAGFSKP
jgi:molybdate transport system substrate-binding protein